MTSAAASDTRRRSPPDIRSTGLSRPSAASPRPSAPRARPRHRPRRARPRRPRPDRARWNRRPGGRPGRRRRSAGRRWRWRGRNPGLGAGDHPQQGGLAAAVAPDHPDPVAVTDPERHRLQHRGGAVALGDVLEVDQVDVSAISRAPSLGRRRRQPDRPAGRRRCRSAPGPVVRACAASRPGTRRSAPSRRRCRPARRVVAGGQGAGQVGRQGDRRRLQVVDQPARPAGGISAGDRLDQPAGRDRGGRVGGRRASSGPRWRSSSA